MVRKNSWLESDDERLKALVASGASALRASIALKRSLAITKLKARKLGTPFPAEADLRAKRHEIFQNSTSRQHVTAPVQTNEDV
jgi:hypothetical protein